MKNPIAILSLVAILVAGGLLNSGLLSLQQSFAYSYPMKLNQSSDRTDNNCNYNCDGNSEGSGSGISGGDNSGLGYSGGDNSGRVLAAEIIAVGY